MLFEIWKYPGSTSLFASCGEKHKPNCSHTFEPNGTLLLSFIASTPIHASQTYCEYLFQSDYNPMLDSKGNIYQKDDSPFPGDDVTVEPLKTVYEQWKARKFPWRSN